MDAGAVGERGGVRPNAPGDIVRHGRPPRRPPSSRLAAALDVDVAELTMTPARRADWRERQADGLGVSQHNGQQPCDPAQWDKTMSERRRRPWTAEEDEAIREAARATFNDGLTVLEDGAAVRAGRLADAARRIGRTVDAVRKRAQRIGAASYPMHRSGCRNGHRAEGGEVR